MKIVSGRNVNEAYTIGLNWLLEVGEPQNTRNGKARVAPCPVTTVYQRPTERVLFNAKRNANPFFHLMEGLWMLAGRNDVKWITQFNSTFGQFSDNGKTFNAAYGWRWREQFGYDQISSTINLLRKDPTTRQAVIAMWDGKEDLLTDSIDRPCNLNICFRVRQDRLDMTVNNRSNDIIWGAYGANAVHMSMLQEYIASNLGLETGVYYQVSNNYHAYSEILDKIGRPDPHPLDPYRDGDVAPYPMVTDPRTWDTDLLNFMMNPCDVQLVNNPFFYDVAGPMARAWFAQKEGSYGEALEILDNAPHTDWSVAGTLWIKRKMEKARDKRARTKQAKRIVAHD